VPVKKNSLSRFERVGESCNAPLTEIGILFEFANSISKELNFVSTYLICECHLTWKNDKQHLNLGLQILIVCGLQQMIQVNVNLT